MIFMSCKGQKRLLTNHENVICEEILRYQMNSFFSNFWICARPMNKEDFKINFVTIKVKLRKLYLSQA